MNEAPVLQDIVRREGRSLLQYISEAFPWATLAGRTALAKLDAMIAEERDAVAALSNFLRKRRVSPPYLGAYPMSFTNINYLSLQHLLPRLVVHQKQAITRLAQDLGQITDPAAREQVERMLGMKREHLQRLEELAVKPEAAATIP